MMNIYLPKDNVLKYTGLVMGLVMMMSSPLLGNPLIYFPPKITDIIKIDGSLDEPVWKKADSLNFLIPVTLASPLSPTVAKILWDDNYLYLGFIAKDEDLKAKLKQRDDPTYQDDVLEIFLMPDFEGKDYLNFEINALGTIYDAMNYYDMETQDRKIRSRWNCDSVQLKIQCLGTLNQSEDKDESWILELKIPFSCMTGLTTRPPESGMKWKFHLARYDYSVYLPKGKELSSCASLTRINFHNYKEWMILEFRED